MTKRFGFTLAEVLITLTIIGVVAAMTIPTLLSNSSDQQYKTGLKKAISTINQAITMQYALEGTDMSDYVRESAAENLFADGGIIKDVFQERMQVVSTTNKRESTEGAHSGDSRTLENAAIYLSDGMVIEFPTASTYRSTQCDQNLYNADTRPNGCLQTILVDVNGNKGKCNVGEQRSTSTQKLTPKDCFPLDVHPDGVRPANFVGREIMYSGK